LVFLLGSTDPAVAVTETGSPAKTAGGLATADRVIGGAFSHPMDAKAKHAKARTIQPDFKSFEYM
jgi:hypothetical protein